MSGWDWVVFWAVVLFFVIVLINWNTGRGSPA